VSISTFPEDFLWGAATAAYQVEGSPLADGAGASIWHRYCRTPGRITDGDTGDVACDQYRRFPQDIGLMQALGLQSYRFSTAWARVMPEGRGRINEAGLDHYDRLVDALLQASIRPCLTLYHWDLPAALDDRGGWLNPDVADWFADYATVMAKRLGDRVPMWITLNEPWVICDAGYMIGVHAPGHRSAFEAATVARNLMRAHGRGVQALRAACPQQVGLTVNLEPKVAASTSPADAAAAARGNAYMNEQYLDPALRGTVPAEALREIYGEGWQDWPDEDLKLACQPLDFLGINFYARGVTVHDDAAWPLRARTVRQPGSAYTAMDWEVHADAFADILRWVHGRYGNLPIYITENGSAWYDPPTVQGPTHPDPQRVSYLREHLLAVKRAMDDGVNVRGYYAWSLLDNLEWSLGYSKRFGIVHVDFASQQRTPKASARGLSRVIATRGACLHDAADFMDGALQGRTA